MTHVEVLTVTPDMASNWLERNTHNRDISRANLQKLKRSLVDGDWRLTTDAIGLDWTDRVQNGQHRLLAIVETGIAAPLLVARGLDPAAMEVVDTGRPRRLEDVLKLRGEQMVALMSSVIRNAVLIETGRVYRNHIHQGVTAVEALRYLNQHPEVRHYAKYASALSKRVPIGPSPIAIAAMLIDRAVGDGDDRTLYFDKLATRADEPEGSPIHAVVNRMISARTQHQSWPVKNGVYLLIHGWNKWSTGQAAQQLRFAPRGGIEFRIPEVVVA